MNLLNHLRTFQIAIVCGGTLFTLSQANAMDGRLEDQTSSVMVKRPGATDTRKQSSSTHYLNERSAEVLLEQIATLKVLMDAPNTTSQEKDEYVAEICLLSSSLDHQETIEAAEAEENMIPVNGLSIYAKEDGDAFDAKVLRAKKIGIAKFRDEQHLDSQLAAHAPKAALSSSVLLEQIAALTVLMDAANTTSEEKDEYEAQICHLSSSLDLQEAREAEEAAESLLAAHGENATLNNNNNNK